MIKEEQLLTLVRRAVQKSVTDNSAVLLSGGIDSSFIAYLALQYQKIIGYTVGAKNAFDINAAESAAKMIGMNMVEIVVNEQDIYDGLLNLISIDYDQDALELSFNLPIYFVCKNAEEKSLLTGQGSDELFGGYKKYKNEPLKMEKDTEKLLNSTIVKEKKIAMYFNKELKMPYLDPEILEFSKKLELSDKINDHDEKIVLRKAAMLAGLPEEIALRKKKAAQYGSGINKKLKKLAKDNNQEIYQFINQLKNKI